MRRIFLTALIAIFAVFTGGYFYIRQTYTQFVVSPVIPITPGVTPDPTPTPDPNQPFSILLLGYGGPAHDGGYLTDTMIVLKLFPKEKRAAYISIPRDLYINLPVTGTEQKPFKINHAYAIGIDTDDYPEKPLIYTGRGGGGALAKFAAGNVIGEPIDFFIAASFAGFKESIDVLGGVDVLVERSFFDEYYPDPAKTGDNCGRTDTDIANLTATMSGFELEKMFPCRYERLEFIQGLTHMNGEMALKYVRSRHSPTEGSDFSRSRRQNQLLSALKSKIVSVNFLPKFTAFIASIRNDVTTDIPFDNAASFVPLLKEFPSYAVKSVFLSTENILTETVSGDGQYILAPKSGLFNWEETAGYIRAQLTADQPATPPATPRLP